MSNALILSFSDLAPEVAERAALVGWTHRAETETSGAWGKSAADALANLYRVELRAREAR